MNSVCLKITIHGKHKGESKNAQQQILAYQLPAGGTITTKTAGTTAVQPMTAALQQTVVQTAIGRFRDHTRRHNTLSRSPLDKWSARNRNFLTDNTQRPQETNIHPPEGFEPAIPSKRAAEDPCLIPRGHWDQQWKLWWRNTGSCSQVTWRSEQVALVKVTTGFIHSDDTVHTRSDGSVHFLLTIHAQKA
jgi:hypothetical protein